VSGATIVRRATQEEREKLESKGRSAAGRKEDNRGTRVTGMGLLSNRVSTAGEGAGGAPASGTESEDAFNRRGGAVAPTGVKDRKTAEEEELAKKKAAAKARRANSGLTTRALLEQAEDIAAGPEPLEEEVAAVPAAQVPVPVSRTVYTPIASRNKRDLKRRKDLKKTQITTPRAAYRVVEMGESITVGELARQLTVKASEIIKKLMSQGVMATINQAIDHDTATLIAHEYRFEVKSTIQTVEDILGTKVPVDESMLVGRPPIVTVMGHVDHGKTSILDAIRSANVARGEAGGITQHIGAYTVEHNDHKITFLDTPGHEAFSAMRARGAGVTDIVVLVVAADDGVMPQTIEAISHAKAAGVPIIVAVNKIDKPNLNFDRIYTELNGQGVQAEEWGGEVQFVKCSALQKLGITELLDAILLQAEVLDLKCMAEGCAEGSVIEAHLDKGRGPVATVVVQAGTLKVGDHVVAGVHVGRVRAMSDHKGTLQPSAGPSIPVEIIGLSGVPMAGDKFNAVADEKTAREAADHRLEVLRKAQSQKSSAQRLEDLIAKVKSEEVPEVVFIVKADTQGSAEAIQESILKLSTPKVKNRIVHCAVGGISESDITLASASGAILIGFNVRAARGLDDLASKEGVVIQYFSIIYEIVDSVKSIMVGKLPPVVSEVVLGHAEVRKPISVPKIGTIGGSAVLDGKIIRSAMCRLIRNQIVIFTGKLGSLRRFKDDVKEVAQGYECGIGIDGYNDLREGDVIEAYVLEETAATL
jgi:translation initiation factor IF-2